MKKKPAKPVRLKRRRSGFPLAAGAIVGALSIAAVAAAPPRVSSNTLSPSSVRIVTQDDTLQMPTPVRPIARGERLGDVEFIPTPWPRSRVSGSYLSDLAKYKDAVALMPLPAAMPVPVSAISQNEGEKNAVVEGIPQGFRAITVGVDTEAAIEGWARSGDYVDVIVLRRSKDPAIGLEAKVIAENVQILSAGRSAEPFNGQSSAPGVPSTVTLLVSQEDALKIKTAASIGKLTFALRGAGDTEPARAVAMTQRALLGGARTTIPVKRTYQGIAKGPDGKEYVLGPDSRWIRTLDSSPPAALLPEGSDEATIGDADG